MDVSRFERRPLVVAIAGPNGAGKSTFYSVYLSQSGLEFVNADVIAAEQQIGPYEAAAAAERRRQELLAEKQSFIFETVFSDPAGAKVAFLKTAAERGYEVVLCFIRLADLALSQTRVSMRTRQGGHDIPNDKLAARFPRSLNNLRVAIATLPNVLVFDNSRLNTPPLLVAEFQNGTALDPAGVPAWLQSLLNPPANPA